MAEAFSDYVGPVVSNTIPVGLAVETDVALPVVAVVGAAPSTAYSSYVGAVTAQTLGLAVETDVALPVVAVVGSNPVYRPGDADIFFCGNPTIASYTKGTIVVGPQSIPVGLAIEQDVAIALDLSVTPVPTTFPNVLLECAFGIDPGKYGFCWEPLARSLVPMQFLRMQGSTTVFADTSRRSSDATGHGSITYQRPSPLSDPAAFAIQLDGSSGYLSAHLNGITDSVAITVIALVYHRSDGFQTLLGFPNCSIGYSADGAYFGLTTDVSGGTDWFAIPAPSLNAWHLITFTLYPENTLDGYATVDGVFVDDLEQRYGDPFAGPPVDPPPPTFANIDFSSGDITWGRDQASADHFLDASLAELMVVPYAVPIDEITALYAARTQGAPPSTDPSTWSWTNLTSRLTEAQTQMGRNSELDRIETAQATFSLDNNDRALEPEYTGSPYSPNVVPMRPIRCRAAIQQTGSQPLYFGYVSDWGVKRPSYIRGAVDVTAVDAGEALMQNQISCWLPQQLPGARIDELLDAAGWPLDRRNIHTGTLLLAEVDYSQNPTTPIDAINQVADSEGGYFYFAADGVATFHDQDTRSNAPYNAPVATFGDGAGEMPYLNPTPDYGIHQVKNVITVTRPDPTGGSDTIPDLVATIRDATDFADLQTELPAQPGANPGSAIALDVTSIQKYRRRELTIDTQLASGQDAGGRAEAALLRYKNPSLRFVSIDLEPRRSPFDMFPAVLTLGIANMIVVVARPVGGGTALVKASYIEAIQHQFSVSGQDQQWTTSYSLSPVLADVGSGIDYWVLGSSVLGYDTRLGL